MIYSIDIVTKYGKHKTFEREFSNERHFSNWYKKAIMYSKIIGVTEIKNILTAESQILAIK